MIVVEFMNEAGEEDLLVVEQEDEFPSAFQEEYPGKDVPAPFYSYKLDYAFVQPVRLAMTGSVGAPDSDAGHRVLSSLRQLLRMSILISRTELKHRPTSIKMRMLSELIDEGQCRHTDAERLQIQESEARRRAHLHRNSGPPDGFDPGSMGG